MKIITKQLSERLPLDHKLLQNKNIDPTNFNKMYQILNSINTKKLCIFDLTESKQIKKGKIIQAMDHINNTGTNILITKQKTLGIDFMDTTNLYSYNKNSIITTCCGETLCFEKKYPCHYMCHIAVLAKAMKFNSISGFLYNAIE